MTGAVLSFTIVVCTAWAPPGCFADQSSFDTPLYSPLEVIAQGHVANLGTVPLRDFIRGGFVFPSQAASRLHLDSEKESSRNMRREPGMSPSMKPLEWRVPLIPSARGPRGPIIRGGSSTYRRYSRRAGAVPEQARALGISEAEVVRNVMLRETVDGEFTTKADVAEAAMFFAAAKTQRAHRPVARREPRLVHGIGERCSRKDDVLAGKRRATCGPQARQLEISVLAPLAGIPRWLRIISGV